MSDSDDLDRAWAIDAIYSAAERRDAWRETFRDLGARLSAHIQILAVRHPPTRPGRALVGALCLELEPADLNAWDTYYQGIEPVRDYVLDQPPLHMFTLEAIGAGDVQRRSEYYHDFARPRGGAHSTYGWAPYAHDEIVALAFHREARFGPFLGEENAFLDDLFPHIVRAVRIHERLEGAERTRDVMDRLVCGVLEIRRDQGIAWANLTAREILAARDGLLVTRGMLNACRADDAARLRRRITEAHLRTTARAGSPTPLAIRRPDGRPPLWVEVVPRFSLLDQPRSVLLLVRRPEAQAVASQAWLRAAFGLTPAESKVARFVADARSVAEIADELRLSQGTVRNHLKQVFAKLGVRRQAQVVRLLRRLAVTRA